ncbi:LPS-assembly protein LptD [Azohydromonas lata]|uniref:LPS-assembly protein LptD n=1 Tax=Azohydromonas lata TaxID=45677 RepID=UPI0008345828|nr:LPS assembly protein LptD [Azohydromonas lata]
MPRPRAERLLALALAAGLPLGAAAQVGAMDDFTPPPALPATPAVPVPAPAPASAPARQQADADANLPVDVQADRIGGRPDVDVEAEGEVDVRRGDVRVQADRARFRQDTQVLKAEGNVRMSQQGNRAKGTELEYKLDTSQGYMLEPEYFIAVTKGGGTAERVDFLGPNRARIIEGNYTSCGLDGEGTPAWLLTAERVDLDMDANEGIARGGVLRFMGVPILAAPRLSFPLSDERKSGWLPPFINIDNRNGLDVAVPYYWNIAPNRDATLTPTLSARRGPGLNSEYRYLEPTYQGRLNLNLLPNDRVAGETRYAFGFEHSGTAYDMGYRTAGVRVSDDNYWKDFTRGTSALMNARTNPYLTPRLLGAEAQVDRGLGDLGLPGGQWRSYARVLTWQVLQDTDPAARITPPYERLPQIGLQGGAPLGGGLRMELQTEINRFSRAPSADPTTIEATRVHALGSLSRPWTTSWGWLTPKASFNAASYSFDQALSDGRTSTSRLIPTLSVDTGLVFERPFSLFGPKLRQTLEPRLLYVRTPYHAQSTPLFDTAVKDFNITSLYAENTFTGVDRVSDANQITAGVTSRFLDVASGNEVGRFTVAQRLLLSDQRITADGVPITQRLSDLLLQGSSMITQQWSADGTLQYKHQTRQVSSWTAGTRYSPGPYRTLAVRYRYTRDASDQIEAGWQWPVYGTAPGSLIKRGSGGGCGGGTLYAVGRTVYSTKESRLVDGIGGFEYDAGCWIFRAIGERISTGTAQATTRLMLQLELVGLSRLGTNPLQLLRTTVPGYLMLRDDPSGATPPPASYE